MKKSNAFSGPKSLSRSNEVITSPRSSLAFFSAFILAAVALVILSPLGSTSSVAAAAPAENPFSVNDLSILFPMKPQTQIPVVEIKAGDANWKLLSNDSLQRILNASLSEGAYDTPALRDPNKWMLHAIRYTPCTLFPGSTPACKEQLRFVFQNIEVDDRTIHVVYNFEDLSAPRISPRLLSFRKLKNSFSSINLNRALTVNPILRSSKQNDYINAIQKEIIQPYINTRSPSKITMMTIGKDSRGDENTDHWIFLTGDIDAQGAWNLTQLSIGAPAVSEHIEVDNDEMVLNSTVDAQKFPKFNLFAHNLTRTDSTQMALQIFDQHQTNDHNMDCASCHNSDSVLFPVLFGSDTTLEERSDFINHMREIMRNQPRLTEILLDDNVHAARFSGVEIPLFRMFGYFKTQPAIAQRTVQDAALAVAQANQLLGLKVETQCGDAKARDQVVACLYFGKAGAKVADCIKKVRK